VRLFSPWRYAVDPAAERLLAATGWVAPDPDGYPTGHELIDGYLAPLAATSALRPHIRLGARVTAVARQGFDKMKTDWREDAPFVLYIEERRARKRRCWRGPSSTPPAPGRRRTRSGPTASPRRASVPPRTASTTASPMCAARRGRTTPGKRVVVVGSGHSAFNAVLDMATLIEEGARARSPGRCGDAPSARSSAAARTTRSKSGASSASGYAAWWSAAPCGCHRLQDGAGADRADGVTLIGEDAALPPADTIIAATGFRPDLAMLRELRLDLDAAVESPTVLAPLIDPNIHSCGTVRPHGAFELQHPEHDFYVAGMKSYGAPRPS
jgi:hypothetical protein